MNNPRFDMDAARAVCEWLDRAHEIKDYLGDGAWCDSHEENCWAEAAEAAASLYGRQARTLLPQALDEITRLREALELYKEAGYQSHSGHWDRTGGGGSGCPECIRARELRARAALAADPGEEEAG